MFVRYGMRLVSQIRELGSQELPNGGGTIPIAPTLLGKLGRDPNKPTLGVYGHLDVQPAQKSDGCVCLCIEQPP